MIKRRGLYHLMRIFALIFKKAQIRAFGHVIII